MEGKSLSFDFSCKTSCNLRLTLNLTLRSHVFCLWFWRFFRKRIDPLGVQTTETRLIYIACGLTRAKIEEIGCLLCLFTVSWLQLQRAGLYLCQFASRNQTSRVQLRLLPLKRRRIHFIAVVWVTGCHQLIISFYKFLFWEEIQRKFGPYYSDFASLQTVRMAGQCLPGGLRHTYSPLRL